MKVILANIFHGNTDQILQKCYKIDTWDLYTAIVILFIPNCPVEIIHNIRRFILENPITVSIWWTISQLCCQRISSPVCIGTFQRWAILSKKWKWQNTVRLLQSQYSAFVNCDCNLHGWVIHICMALFICLHIVIVKN